MTDNSKFVELGATGSFTPTMTSRIGTPSTKGAPAPDPKKFVELSGQANIDSKEIFRMLGQGQSQAQGSSQVQGTGEAPAQLTYGDLMQMLLGKLLFGQLMNQPVSQEAMTQLLAGMAAQAQEAAKKDKEERDA